MSELVTFLGGLGPWLLVPLILLALLLIGYFDLYCQAMRPPVGTLEWISNYDRPPFSFARHRYRLSRWDAGSAVSDLPAPRRLRCGSSHLLEDTSTQSSSATFLLLLLASLLELATVLLPAICCSSGSMAVPVWPLSAVQSHSLPIRSTCLC